MDTDTMGIMAMIINGRCFAIIFISILIIGEVFVIIATIYQITPAWLTLVFVTKPLRRPRDIIYCPVLGYSVISWLSNHIRQRLSTYCPDLCVVSGDREPDMYVCVTHRLCFTTVLILCLFIVSISTFWVNQCN